MAGFSDSLELQVLDHVFLGGVAMTRPASLHIALYTADPLDTGAGATEITGNAYARAVATFNQASTGAVTNALDITFPQATGTWGTITHAGIFDASTAGTLLAVATVTGTPSVVANDTLKLPAGQFTVSLD